MASELDPTMQMYQQWGKSPGSPSTLSGVTSSFLGMGNTQQQYNPTTQAWQSMASAPQGPSLASPLPQQKVGTGTPIDARMTPGTQTQTGQPFANYQDYSRYARRATPDSVFSEDQWNDPGVNHWDQMGNMYNIMPGDPNYDEAKAAILAAHPGADVRSLSVSSVPHGIDHGKTVRLPNGNYVTSVDNYTQPQNDGRDALLGIGTVLGGGFLANSLFGAGAGAAAGGTEAAAGAGGFYDTLPAFETPASTLPTMIDGPSIGGGSSLFSGAGSSAFSNPLLRGAGSLATSLLGGGGNNTTRPMGTGNGAGDGGAGGSPSLWDLMSGAGSMYANNRNIQSYQDQLNNLMNRGDYNSQYRPGYLSSLNESYTNPDKFLAPYAEGDARDLENMRRSLGAKGYGMSGNELGELTSLQGEQRRKHLSDYRNDIRSSISLGNPDQMASAAMRNLPFLYQMRANRDAGATSTLGRMFGRGGSTSRRLPGDDETPIEGPMIPDDGSGSLEDQLPSGNYNPDDASLNSDIYDSFWNDFF